MNRLSNITPWDILRSEWLEPLHLSVSDFAKKAWFSLDDAFALVYEKKKVTQEIAEKLYKYSGSSIGFWLGLQEDYEEWERITTIEQEIENKEYEIEELLSKNIGFPICIWVNISYAEDMDDFIVRSKKFLQRIQKIPSSFPEYRKIQEYIQDLITLLQEYMTLHKKRDIPVVEQSIYEMSEIS